MNQKFHNLIAWVTIFFCLALFTLAYNWYWVKNDPSVQGLIFGLLFSFVGAIVGGLASGYGSYLGGVEGAEKNYGLLRSLASEEKNGIMDEHSRQLFAQLKFSYKLIVKSIDWVPINGLIYDVEWYKHLAAIDSLDLYQKETITKWFHEIIMLQNSLEIEYQINGEKISESPLRQMMMGKPGYMQAYHVQEKFVDLIPEIKEILNKNFWLQGTK